MSSEQSLVEPYFPANAAVPARRSSVSGPLAHRMVKRSNGRSLVRHAGIPAGGRLGYLKDFFTSLVNSQWYVIIITFFTLYALSWLLFGGVWTVLAYSYPSGNFSCVQNVNDFNSAFLFSLEAQTTIGFGFRYPNSSCGVGTFFLVVQSLLGLLLDSFLLGLVFAKLSRPRNRRKTLLFSSVAVIHEEGGQRVLEFRIADVRRSQVVEAHVRLQLYWYQLADPVSGRYEFQQFDLDVGYDTGRDRVFLLTPVSVYHYITESSPLHGITPEELARSYLEVVVILEGIVEATGLTAQALWSYTKDEILFNRKFEPAVSYSKEGGWEVDFSRLSNTMELGHIQ